MARDGPEMFGGDIVMDWPANQPARMGPACDRLYQAVMEQTITHDGDSRLAAHVANARAKSTSFGDVITKDRRNSPRKIDLAVGAVMALDRAAQLPPKRRAYRVASF